jgi:glutamate carboxypeptidase
MHGPALLQTLQTRQEEMLAALAMLVNHESPSTDRGALEALARVLTARFGALGADVRLVANATGGDHIRARFGAPTDPGRPALVLAHYDTIWPAGTLATLPFRREGGRAFGPGIYDMKASLVVLEFALAALVALDLRPPRPIVALLTSDEEIGSPSSRPLIEELAQGSAYTLVLEPPLADGGLKTARKGVGRFTVEIVGRPAHAGVEPEKGISAVQELAHQVLHLHGLGHPAAGTTVNVGVVAGGTAPNVVAARAHAVVDVRVVTMDEAGRIDTALHALRPVLPGARITVDGGFNRPPMERTPQVEALYQRARLIGRTLGLDLTEGSTGGASDANFTAALGVPTLDGLGARGSGAHAEDEQIEIDSLPERAALLAALLLEL